MPGWALAALVLYVLASAGVLSRLLAIGLFAAWLVKDLALYPFVRIGYERGDPHQGTPLGALAVAVEPLAPEGYVRLGAELWRARLVGRERALPGDTLRVCGVRDLTLLVEPAENAAPHESG